jgi:hypothetical protein
MSASDKLEQNERDMEEASSSFINRKLADEPWPYCVPEWWNYSTAATYVLQQQSSHEMYMTRQPWEEE